MEPLNLENKRVVLLLQGGGALGAYQVGAHKALAEKCHIDWVAGISIGAINSSVIAGHKGRDASQELESLWDEILSPPYPPFDCTSWLEACRPWLPPTWLWPLEPKYADWAWTAFNLAGQRNFFSSRVLNPLQNPWMLQWFRKLQRDEMAFYDTSRLAATLRRHVDFSGIHKGSPTRLCLGAARVCDGEVEFFDSDSGPLTADHVLASAALPPAFPPIQIAGEWYFDGGISSNTPIEVLQDKLFAAGPTPVVIFLVDLWDRKHDPLPESFDDVLWRQKSIQFGSRKRAAETVLRQHETDQRLMLYVSASGAYQPRRVEICQIMLEEDEHDPQFSFSDADFSRGSYEKLRRLGYQDMKAAIEHPQRVPGVGGEYAALYRQGTRGKWALAANRVHRHTAA